MPTNGPSVQNSFTAELDSFYSGIFEAMEQLIREQQDSEFLAEFRGDQSIPPLLPGVFHPASGLWRTEGILPGQILTGMLDLALIPGDTRISLRLPRTAVHSLNGVDWLKERIARSFDGEPPSVLQRGSDYILFEHHFRNDPVFDLEAFVQAMADVKGIHAQILVQRLAYTLTTVWGKAILALYSETPKLLQRSVTSR